MRGVLRSLLVVSLLTGSAIAGELSSADAGKPAATTTTKTKKHHKARTKKARKAKQRHKSQTKTPK